MPEIVEGYGFIGLAGAREAKIEVLREERPSRSFQHAYGLCIRPQRYSCEFQGQDYTCSRESTLPASTPISNTHG